MHMLRYRNLLLALCTVGFGWQDALTRLEMTQASFESNIKNYLQQELGQSEYSIPGIGAKQRTILREMDDASRAVLVKELAAMVKSIVMSPAFQSSYEAYLKSSKNAVNHGLKATDSEAEMKAASEKMMKSGDVEAIQSSMEKMIRDQMKTMVVRLIPQIANWGKNEVNGMADGILNQLDTIPPRNAAEKAQRTQGIALLKEAMTLAETNLPSAKEKVKTGMLMAVYAGDGNAANAQADEGKLEQQRNYNKYGLKPGLKRQLLAVATEIKSVDFKATTVTKGNTKYFANPNYEKKDAVWKLLYRMGPATAQAAAQFAAAWAAEL